MTPKEALAFLVDLRDGEAARLHDGLNPDEVRRYSEALAALERVALGTAATERPTEDVGPLTKEQAEQLVADRVHEALNATWLSLRRPVWEALNETIYVVATLGAAPRAPAGTKVLMGNAFCSKLEPHQEAALEWVRTHDDHA